ncbi:MULTISPECIES: PPE family protein [unclassified Mycobacterium]|uniref:PPE family protein n=1 Tax=unclassified Mycobacterium TaxID=2642494 RepID=UPI002741EA24|nr:MULTISPECIES: PPE family protein [unclassified Mycobacterium]MDP7706550.1 PPE family protein [Mycobacterium sp. TY815]MDP7725664.1 PPE family protein [Mycobacterium sp. TY814]
MVDYGMLPPEINSARIYAGPGAASLVSAAVAWENLAADFAAAASGHRSVIETLTSGPWLGPASTKLVSAVSPFITWLSNSAEQAAETASQAGVAAAAYERAYAASVPPPIIAANRALLQELIATNILGQNSSAISTLEAQYAEFWAQDSGAMYTYAGSAAAATNLTPLAAPADAVDPMGVVDQGIAAFKAAGTGVQTQLNNIGSTVGPRISDVMKTLSSPLNGQGAAIDAWIIANTPLDDIVPLYSKYMSPYINSVAAMIQSTQTIGQNTSGFSGLGGLANTLLKPAAPAAAKAAEGAAAAASGAGQAAAGAAGNLGAGLGGVAGSLGKAVPIGGLSAPASWVPWHATTNPGIASAIPAAAEGGNSFPMAPPIGQFVNGGYGRNVPQYGFKPSVMAKPPAAG